MKNLLHQLEKDKENGKKKIAVLLDPDKVRFADLSDLVEKAKNANIGYFFVGGSFVEINATHELVSILKKLSEIPVILFPGNSFQLTESADALFFLSLISGRNPDLLIGQHVLAAPLIAKMDLEVIPTGYLLIEGNRLTTAHYISNTLPIPRTKPELAACTVLAGQFLGLKAMYLDAGSGADEHIPLEMIQRVSQTIHLPLIIGGGIKDFTTVQQVWNHGADVVVIGSAIEKNPDFLENLANFQN